MAASGQHTGRELGPYVLKGRLGKGGMGEVYLAYDRSLDRQVAVKLVVERLAHEPALIQRFEREAKAAARLNHPNIVQVHAVDVASETPYLVMEYVDGAPLDTFIKPDKPLPWHEALEVVRQVAAALQCAHSRGVVHRDIKPQNILVDRERRVRVSDFGIAKIMGSDTRLTGAQMTLGSPVYMSPEHCGVGEVGPGSDLYSLGITLFEMVTGQLPFQAVTPLAVIQKVTQEPLPALEQFVPGIPVVVQSLLDKLTAKSPEERYQSAQEILEDIDTIRAGQIPPRLLAGTRTGVHAASSAGPTAGGTPRGLTTGMLVDDLLERPSSAFTRAPAPPRREIPWVTLLVAGVAALVLLFALPVLARLANRVAGAGRTGPAAREQAPPPVQASPEPEFSAGAVDPAHDGIPGGGPPPPGGFPGAGPNGSFPAGGEPGMGMPPPPYPGAQPPPPPPGGGRGMGPGRGPGQGPGGYRRLPPNQRR